ncbi:MAG: hypothetical protein HY735_14150 [Verrucomicrobia bacterium]|nr:hypothetical protein [Verrucomicrobiota bacterium]
MRLTAVKHVAKLSSEKPLHFAELRLGSGAGGGHGGQLLLQPRRNPTLLEERGKG